MIWPQGFVGRCFTTTEITSFIFDLRKNDVLHECGKSSWLRSCIFLAKRNKCYISGNMVELLRLQISDVIILNNVADRCAIYGVGLDYKYTTEFIMNGNVGAIYNSWNTCSIRTSWFTLCCIHANARCYAINGCGLTWMLHILSPIYPKYQLFRTRLLWSYDVIQKLWLSRKISGYLKGELSNIFVKGWISCCPFRKFNSCIYVAPFTNMV